VIAGSTVWWGPNPAPTPGGDVLIWQFKDRAAALDSQGAISFIEQHLRTAKNGWKDECQALYDRCDKWPHDCGEQPDTDEDGIVDVCDDCPTVHNPEQLDSDDDPDHDGIGAACDFCPELALSLREPWLSNCNYELELGLAFAGFAAPPVLGKGSAPNARAEYRHAFRHDACDPTPCPRHALTSEGQLQRTGL
jgi:hypothetical protein